MAQIFVKRVNFSGISLFYINVQWKQMPSYATNRSNS